MYKRCQLHQRRRNLFASSVYCIMMCQCCIPVPYDAHHSAQELSQTLARKGHTTNCSVSAKGSHSTVTLEVESKCMRVALWMTTEFWTE